MKRTWIAGFVFVIAVGLSMFLVKANQKETPEYLAGYYVLRGGPQDMGGEMALRKDGTFGAIMVYGSAEGQAKGRWRMKDNTVFLETDARSKSEDDLSGLFRDLKMTVGKACLEFKIWEQDTCFFDDRNEFFCKNAPNWCRGERRFSAVIGCEQGNYEIDIKDPRAAHIRGVIQCMQKEGFTLLETEEPVKSSPFEGKSPKEYCHDTPETLECWE